MSAPSLHLADETSVLLQRYNVGNASQILYTFEELRGLGVHPEFVLTVLDVFEEPSTFHPENFKPFELPVILDYLRKTHAYYLRKKLPEIEQTIHLLVNAYPDTHPLLYLLHSFYHDYQKHLRTHIEIEEDALFPYIDQLIRAEVVPTPSIPHGLLTVQEFMIQHHDTEKDLADVRKAILTYSPPEGNQTLYRILLSQLHMLEKDLAVHALIEDHVLLPRALALESQRDAS